MLFRSNRGDNAVWSVDIPSGIHADTGEVLGGAIKADKTITFHGMKIGQWCYPAIDYIGELELVDIGIPKALTVASTQRVLGITKESVAGLLKKRPTRSNKGTYGKVLLVGGQQGMSGAITLATEAAMKVGAGTVTALVPATIQPVLATKLTSCMTLAAPDENGHFDRSAVAYLAEQLEKYTLVAVGPGMGRAAEAVGMIQPLLCSKVPCVIDADGLYLLKCLLSIRLYNYIIIIY